MSKIRILGLAFLVTSPLTPLAAQDFFDTSGLAAQTTASRNSACQGKTAGEACSYTQYMIEREVPASGSCSVVETEAATTDGEGTYTTSLTCQ